MLETASCVFASALKRYPRSDSDSPGGADQHPDDADTTFGPGAI